MRRREFAWAVAVASWLCLAACGPEPGAEQGSAAEADSARAQITQFWGHYREATRLRLTGDFAAAIEAYERALALQPEHEDALYYLGNALLETGHPTGAREAWLRLVAVNPNAPRAYSQLGQLALCRPEPDVFDLTTSARAFLRAHELNREETGPLLRLAQVALLEGRTDSAATLLDDIIISHPGSADALYLRAFVDRTRGRQSEALAGLERLITPAPADPADTKFSGEGDTRPETAATGMPDVECPVLAGLIPSWNPPPADLEAAFARSETVLREARRLRKP